MKQKLSVQIKKTNSNFLRKKYYLFRLPWGTSELQEKPRAHKEMLKLKITIFWGDVVFALLDLDRQQLEESILEYYGTKKSLSSVDKVGIYLQSRNKFRSDSCYR
jgi:hypothetical protein